MLIHIQYSFMVEWGGGERSKLIRGSWLERIRVIPLIKSFKSYGTYKRNKRDFLMFYRCLIAQYHKQ